MKKILVVSLIILLTLNMMLTGYGAQIDQLKIAIRGEEGALNPYTYVSETGATIFRLVYDPLFNKSVDLIPEPWLVKEYTLSDDGLVYVFELHDNVKFHDGQPLTAEDVKFTYEYLKQYRKSRFSGPAAAITEIVVLDEFTVQMTLSSPQAEFLTRPLAEMGILPKHIWETITDPDTSRETIGSGPYKLTEIKDGEYYIFEANNEYFNGMPVTKQIYMPIIKDASAMFTALQAGQIDVTTVELPPETIDQFANNPNLKVQEGPGYSTTLLLFNNERYPFDNHSFREALAYATNRQEIVDVIMLGKATKGSLGFVHPMSAAYNNQVNELDFDIAKANEILDSLNFIDTNNDGIRETEVGEKLSFEILVYASNPLRIRIAELIKESYASIGVDVTVTAMDMAVVDDLVWPNFEAANGRDYDMAMWGWGASTMDSSVRYIDMFYSDLTVGNSNIVAYSSEVMDEILELMKMESDPMKKIELQKRFQVILSQDYPCITLYYPNLAYAYNPNVFDQWKFIKGSGIVNPLSLIDMTAVSEPPVEEPTEQPTEEPTAPTEQPPAEDEGNNNMLVLGIMIVAALVVLFVSRKKLSKK
ncbi:MAG TPA: ABC transporter substrate-binding protein [Clostridiales bacterium]|jgi:peptide/nickel transport system substrate-binding protein|nr:ABC transporter substrate-binding protein [Clostridiales bacterium]